MKPTETINSSRNPLVQRARAVRDGREPGIIFVEGVRLCEEAAQSGLSVEMVFCSANLQTEPRISQLLRTFQASAARIVFVSERVLESMSDTKTPQGLIALAQEPANGRARLEQTTGTHLVVVMHKVNNPANAGAMLRVAEAAGATAVITTKTSTSLFSAKALRGSMGSAFRLPLWPGADLHDALSWCAERNIKTVSAGTQATTPHTALDWTIPRAIIVGPEAGGLTSQETGATDEVLMIPMRAPVESLNVAVALGVILYEAARQRKFS